MFLCRSALWAHTESGRQKVARCVFKPAENWAEYEGDNEEQRSAALGVAARVFSVYEALLVVERLLRRQKDSFWSIVHVS